MMRGNKKFLQSSSTDRLKCLIGCSGSVATVKIPELAMLLSKEYDVIIVMTKNAKFFLDRAKEYNPVLWEQFINIQGLDMILEDIDEWESWNKIGDPVLHIELRRWADMIVIVPASANFLAKASVGITDNFLLSIVRAWDFDKPCFLCPAMNTFMWLHPSTAIALHTLESWGWKIIAPIEKKLACNDVGSGALAPVSVIVDAVQENIGKRKCSSHLNDPSKTEFFTGNDGRRKLIQATAFSLGIMWFIRGAMKQSVDRNVG